MSKRENVVIMETPYGSRLYRTHNLESDHDAVRVVVPHVNDYILGKDGKTTHINDGHSEMTTITISELVRQAIRGESMATDLLHVRPDQATLWSEHWNAFHEMRGLFYTCRMKAFVGYANAQIAKYGMKASRLDAVTNICALLSRKLIEDHKAKLNTVLDDILEEDHTTESSRRDIRCVVVCGKTLLGTISVQQALDILLPYKNQYGNRVQSLQSGTYTDWKAISHAYRAAFVVRHILKNGDFSYPLPETPLIVDIKSGSVDANKAITDLETLLEEVDLLVSKSTLPEEVHGANLKKIENKLIYTVDNISKDIPYIDE